MMLSCHYDVVRVGRKAKAGSIDKGAGPNGPKGRGLMAQRGGAYGPTCQSFKTRNMIGSDQSYFESDLGYFLC